ncbi:hypothetical protein CSIV_14385 [Microbacterium sp. CSI-V]|nr:hypothetical protein CSIV_14385 [Microbacterium sp. CSI-V]
MSRDLIAELRGFAEGSTSARASLMRDAADAIDALSSPPADDVREALDQLDVLNESGRIQYADYVALHDMVSRFEVRLRGTVTPPADDVREALTIEQVYEVVIEDHGVQALVEHARRQAAYCCQHGCGSGACESCPCCAAGWCVSGSDGMPENQEDLAQWLEVAAEHNPVAAALAEVRLRGTVNEPTDAEVEAGARAAALHADYEGCFLRIDEWEALEEWEREAHPENRPDTDYEDAEFWRTRTRAALTAAAGVHQRGTVTDAEVAAALDARATMSQFHIYLYATEKCRCGEDWSDAHWMRYVLEAAREARP